VSGLQDASTSILQTGSISLLGIDRRIAYANRKYHSG